jgi:hypothetical protein
MVEGDNTGRDKKATHETMVFGDNVYKKFWIAFHVFL